MAQSYMAGTRPVKPAPHRHASLAPEPCGRLQCATMRQLWRPDPALLTPYQAGKSLEQLEKELGLPAIVRLSANENPLGPSPRVVEAIRREAANVHLYPDGGSTAVREALGQWIGVSP